MKKVLSLIVFLLVLQVLKAQPYGNEWIDYSQTHARVKVAANGWYRIPYTLIRAAFPNINNINPSQFIMYNKGQAVPIFVSANLVFTTNDYIEFFGERNTGDLDSNLYLSGKQTNPDYSLFTDTSVYYLTLKNAPNNPRYTIINNNLTSPPPVESYFYYAKRINYLNTFSGGKNYFAAGDLFTKSLFEEGEGYGSAWINASSALFNISLPAKSLYNSANLNAYVKVAFQSWSHESHNIEMKWNNTPFFSTAHYSYKFVQVAQTLPMSAIDTANKLTFDELATATSSNQNLVHYAELNYPRKFEFDSVKNFQFTLLDNNTDRYLEINKFNSSNSKPILYDVTNGLIIKSVDSNNIYPKRYVLPAAAGERKMYMRADIPSTLLTIAKIDTVRFTDFSLAANQGDYLILTHKVLTEFYNNRDYTEEYAKYRRSTAGGTHKVVKAMIDEIYDQFNYGVAKSPLAVRNFVAFAADNWPAGNKPVYLFLLGKGRVYTDYRNNTVPAFKQCLVPTFGTPPSDIMLAARRNNDEPQLAVGRIAAETPAEVKLYLDKVIEFESAQNKIGDPYQTKKDKLWMKNVLHFAGGSDVAEQDIIKAYLAQYRATLEDTSWGAKINTFEKKYNVPIDNTVAALIKTRVDNGVSLMTFFGHSAAASFEFDINPVSQWGNKGKYPLILSNGCFSGMLHAAGKGASEIYTLTADKGIIGMIATPSLSLSNMLHDYSKKMMKRFAVSKYNQPVGLQMQDITIEVEADPSSNDFLQMISAEMTLHADPAIRLSQFNDRDYQIDSSSIIPIPNLIDASLDSFDVKIDITNLGKAFKDTIAVCFTRSIKDLNNQNLDYDYKKFIKAPYYRDTVSFRLPTRITPELGLGENTFTAFVECDQVRSELSETNNGYQRKTTILAEDVIPIYPYEFAIVPKQNPTLKASTVNPFAPLQRYRMQIDTTELFNSPVLNQTTITQVGGVLHWTVPITFKDSTVYYWRVSKDSLSPSKRYNWKKSSFLYLKDEYPGWNQSHYYQYQKDYYPDYVYQDTDRVFKYVNDVTSINVLCGWADVRAGNIPFNNLTWSKNGVKMHACRMGSCGFNQGITFGVINNLNGQNWVSKNNAPSDFAKFGNYHCANKFDDQAGFDFHVYGNHPSLGIPWHKVVLNFLDSIPQGYFVVMYSNNKIDWKLVDTSLLNRLASMGAVSMPILKRDSMLVPYTFFTQVGNNSLSEEAVGVNYSTPLSKNYVMRIKWYEGTYLSKPIGPAIEWGSMHWRPSAMENPTTDYQYVSILGVDNNGAETLLHTTTTLDSTINWINPVQYPYIRLKMTTRDTVTKTPTQLKYWRVLYKKVPEAAINPAAHFYMNKDTLQIGDSLRIEVALENVTEYDMDSMLTHNTLENISTNTNINTPILYDSLRAYDTLILKYNIPINNNLYDGNDKIIIEANPETIDHQLEQYHFNNYAIIKFVGQSDKINPLLDVTFDGQHILNGDLVSSKPHILISLKDENKYLALNDTSLMQVYIKYPGEAQPRKLLYDNQIMTFFPATGNLTKNNLARIELNPELLVDGTYELIVKDKDRSENNSSNNDTKFLGNYYYDYRITFEVMNKTTISNVLNYPNPFSTSTRFVFTITGSQVPDYMKIQIMTITGIVVKEITKEELGPLRVGTNITQYAWDGKDEYGDKLANGVYFYRVISKINNENIEKLESTHRILQQSDFDKYFKKGFGKMVILR